MRTMSRYLQNHCRRVIDARLARRGKLVRRILPDRTVLDPAVADVVDVDLVEDDVSEGVYRRESGIPADLDGVLDGVDGVDSKLGGGDVTCGLSVGDRRVQEPGRSAPIHGTRSRSRQQSLRLLMPVIPVMLTGVFVRIRCFHAGTS